jgi:UDP-N-acetylmuramoyl-L-alanyl-D-glutamate--2,6-diaminopimelate ligase
MEKKLKDLLTAIEVKQVTGDVEKTVTSVICDSREASAGSLFIAVKGVAVDAHKYIPDVVAKGATAVVL